MRFNIALFLLCVRVCVRVCRAYTVTLKPKRTKPTPTVEKMMCYSVNYTIDQTDACLG